MDLRESSSDDEKAGVLFTSDISWKLAAVLLSACWHFALFCITSKPNDNYPDPNVQVVRANYLVSLFHASITSSVSLYLQRREFADLDIFSFFNHRGSPTFQFLSCFLMGYMLYDLQTVTLYKKTKNKLYAYHHLIAMIGALIGISGRFAPMICLLYLGELPVVLVDIQMLADFADMPRFANLVKPVTNATWVILRLFMIPYLCYKTYLYHQLYAIPDQMYFWFLVYIFVSLSVMNIYWTHKLMRNTYNPRKSTSKEN